MEQAATRVVLQVEETKWRRADVARIRSAARRTLQYVKRSGEVTIRLTTDEGVRLLNERFRGKPKATNVLSFPSPSQCDGYLGDIAVAFDVTRNEAKSAGKALADHAAHLAVHGVLHLVGYDHELPRDARIMEELEVVILKEFGIGDPYTSAIAVQ